MQIGLENGITFLSEILVYHLIERNWNQKAQRRIFKPGLLDIIAFKNSTF